MSALLIPAWTINRFARCDHHGGCQHQRTRTAEARNKSFQSEKAQPLRVCLNQACHVPNRLKLSFRRRQYARSRRTAPALFAKFDGLWWGENPEAGVFHQNQFLHPDRKRVAVYGSAGHLA